MHEVESLTLHEADELLEYWSEHPPAHVLLAALMRARPLQKKSSQDLASAVAGSGGRVLSAPGAEISALLRATAKIPD